ncbi:hypothetical protein FFK22_010430 [Mycobacterium sp. KBS0706]|uniref:hypothetical protein n=1 Tax=Mycobacterium sp. KBS0706 TaxID=2578109 RepID=UPI00110F9D42|nr:hypothetical protein [Mycobacterium sp. KBS0706]TSD88690.1 hypothetical protein FFK22_010430 [Mycobacterium sp. KBS0706]
MTSKPDLRGPVALKLLRLFPKSIRRDISQSESFRSRYGLTVDSVLTLNGLGIAFRGSQLFPAIRTLFKGPESSVLVKPVEGDPVEVSIEPGAKPELFLTLGEARHRLPPFWMLAEDRGVRLAYFEGDVAAANLPTSAIENWREKIEKGPLSEDEMHALTDELKLTPQSVAARMRGELIVPDGQVSVIVPGKASYYRGLIGERGEATNVDAYAAGNAKGQIVRLLKWDFARGLAQCLLLCANPRLSALIDISERPAADVEAFFAWLLEQGDLFSQIAGIEIGIRSLKSFPALEPILVRMLERIRDEDPDDESGRLALTANLFVFADGELSRTRLFASEPPFWRRLAASAQASMIERELVALGGTGGGSSSWASLRAEPFYIQALADLRQEPRSIPDLISAMQFQIELLMRARIAGNENKDTLPEGPLKTLLLGDGENDLPSRTSHPLACAPSPVEGGIDASLPFPEDLLEELRKPKDEKPLEARVFASVVNFSLAFRFDTETVDLIAGLLRKVKYRLELEPNSDIGFSLIMGLAIIAASARHSGLADEVRILSRVLRRRGVIDSAAENQMRIALTACASRSDLEEWCKAVGEWFFEIANGEIGREGATRLRYHLKALCRAVPQLWPHISKAEAALAAISH